MRKHVIAGRFNLTDSTHIVCVQKEVKTSLDLLSIDQQLLHGIGKSLMDLREFNVYPSEIGLDLVILAAHVHAADTRISRSTESQDGWTREIRLIVPVSNLTLWERSICLLEEMLQFLTGDRWQLEFRSRSKEFNKLVFGRPRGIKFADIRTISLFSGGLDSLIGAIDQIETGNSVILISHAQEGAVSVSQDACYEGIRRYYEAKTPQRLRLWMRFPDGFVNGVGKENTTRARSFLFIAAGLFAGSGVGQSFILRVPENGLIALNVPLDPLRLGALSTRTTHPYFLTMWNELCRNIELPGQVVNPYWNLTKGEMISRCGNQNLLRQLLAETMSCSSPTKGRWKGHGPEHCGYCLPCIIRRAAIIKGFGLEHDPTEYSIPNLGERPLNSLASEGEQVRSLQYAIQRLQENPQIARILVRKPGPLPESIPNVVEELSGVYSRGLQEVATFIENVHVRPGTPN